MWEALKDKSCCTKAAEDSSARSRREKSRHRMKKFVDNEDDGSQAWCIVVCCFIVNVLVMGFLKCLGILIIELMKAFKASAADVSVLVSITSCLNCVAGPLACYLVVKFTARTIAFTGTSLVSIGLILSWFATSINYLYVSIGVLVGFGSGLTYSPGVILIGNYFTKNRGMANGIVVSGSPVGGMIIPYMLNFLVHYLECRGALLILGGLMLNGVVCTLSYSPYRKPKSSKIIVNEDYFDDFCNARQIEASVNIPLAEVTKSSTTDPVAETTLDDSDDSSGPEFVDAISSQSMNPTLITQPTASTGSVIVYKVNEKYGQAKKSSGDSHKKQKGKKHSAATTKPELWKIPDDTKQNSLEEQQALKSDLKENGDNPGFLSATVVKGHNIQSKESQTQIPLRETENKKVIAHPFASHIRRTIEDAKLKSNPKHGSSGSGSGNYPQNTSPVAVASGNFSPAFSIRKTDSNPIGGSSMDSTLRNRKPNREQAGRKKEPPTVSTKKLSPYILSLDHSCVIMWSNDNVAKNKNPSTTILKTSIGSVHGQRSGDGDNISQFDSIGGTSTTVNNDKGCGCCSRFMTWIRNSPLSSGIYLTLLFSNTSTAIATTNILLLIPSLGEHRGLSKAEYSTTYLIISVADMTARLLGAFISDRGLLSSKTLFAGGLGLAGFCSLLIAFSNSFLTICLVSSMFGFATGLHIGIYGTLLAEIVGIELLHVGYAFCMILNGILQFTFIYVSGKILSSNPDAFTNLFVFYGVVLSIGGFLWLVPAIFAKLSKQNTNFGTANENNMNCETETNVDNPSLSNKLSIIKSASINKNKTPTKAHNSKAPMMSNISLQ